MSHLDDGLLHALLDGEIPSPELPPIQAHLAVCAECRARLETERQLLVDAEGLVAALEVPAGDAVPGVPRGSPTRPGRWRALAWAASVIAAVGLGYVARGAEAPRASREMTGQLPAAHADSAGVVASSSGAKLERVANAPESSASPKRTGIAARKPTIARNDFGRVVPKEEAKVASERLQEVVVSGRAPPDSQRVAQEPQAAPPAAGALGARLVAPRLRDEARRFDRVNISGIAEAQASAATLAPPEPSSLPDAIRRLGGSLRLIEGLIPLRLEAQGVSVRVVYAVPQGELVLSQQLIDGRVAYQLIAPAGFPADSLARFKARVRE